MRANATGQGSRGQNTRAREDADHNNSARKKTDPPQKTHPAYADLKHLAARQSSARSTASSARGSSAPWFEPAARGA
jgi:hypothetical protein